jgi:hypothetical protein
MMVLIMMIDFGIAKTAPVLPRSNTDDNEHALRGVRKPSFDPSPHASTDTKGATRNI